MSWGEVTKINDNLNIPLNKLIGSNFNMLVNNVSGDSENNAMYGPHNNMQSYYDSNYKYCKPLNSINEHIDRTLFSSSDYYTSGFVVYVDDIEYGVKINTNNIEITNIFGNTTTLNNITNTAGNGDYGVYELKNRNKNKVEILIKKCTHSYDSVSSSVYTNYKYYIYIAKVVFTKDTFNVIPYVDTTINDNTSATLYTTGRIFKHIYRAGKYIEVRCNYNLTTDKSNLQSLWLRQKSYLIDIDSDTLVSSKDLNDTTETEYDSYNIYYHMNENTWFNDIDDYIVISPYSNAYSYSMSATYYNNGERSSTGYNMSSCAPMLNRIECDYTSAAGVRAYKNPYYLNYIYDEDTKELCYPYIPMSAYSKEQVEQRFNEVDMYFRKSKAEYDEETGKVVVTFEDKPIGKNEYYLTEKSGYKTDYGENYYTEYDIENMVFIDDKLVYIPIYTGYNSSISSTTNVNNLMYTGQYDNKASLWYYSFKTRFPYVLHNLFEESPIDKEMIRPKSVSDPSTAFINSACRWLGGRFFNNTIDTSYYTPSNMYEYNGHRISNKHRVGYVYGSNTTPKTYTLNTDDFSIAEIINDIVDGYYTMEVFLCKGAKILCDTSIVNIRLGDAEVIDENIIKVNSDCRVKLDFHCLEEPCYMIQP